ncbi:MAG TPA: hypothetical protein VMF08_05780 [Candidatus Sulfotelmatobacter sp.]|nr:hypothetical protein [Candidatus Sulfotelmatobacter sp.]
MKALQEGVVYTNFWGVVRRKAFTADEGYFPVSRMISTFPSTSDVAWTDIFGNRPLSGYQRTYYSVAANSEVAVNGLTSTMEHERQMDWQSQSDFTRSMGYIYSEHVYDLEVHEMLNSFWATDDTNANYYAYIRSSDDAQHMDRDVYSLLCTMDRKLQELRARYRAAEGRDLQILILSDHGHNHAGRGERVQICPFLEAAGYRVAQSIQNSNDVVLPTSGIEDWIEIHNAPSETARLAEKLTRLKGMDVLAARLPEPSHRFLVLNSRDERAFIDWNPKNNTYRYSAVSGDPLNYGPVATALGREGKLDANGFAPADDWMNATMTNHYPLALQRIVRGLTSVTLNPATILVSLDNHYVHASALINDGSMLSPCGSTHGALDDINSMGIVLSNFTPTHDTPTDRVAAYFGGFPGLRNFRDEEDGAEWVRKSEQARTRIRRDPFDWNYQSLPANRIFLRVWSPDLADAGTGGALQTSVVKVSGPDEWQPDPPATLQPNILHERNYTFGAPVSFPQNCPYERIYPCPADMTLEPQSSYRIAGWVRDGRKNVAVFEFVFQTDKQGRPAAF